MKNNYKKQIKELLSDNGLKLVQTSGIGLDFKCIYIEGLTPTGCFTVNGKNYKDCLSKIRNIINSSEIIKNSNIEHNKQIKPFKRKVIFHDKKLQEYVVEIKFENDYCDQENVFDFGAYPVSTNSHGGKWEPAGEHQQKLLDLKEKWGGYPYSTRRYPLNLEKIVDDCIKNIKQNNKKNIFNRRGEFDNGDGEYHSVLEGTENYINGLTNDVVDSRDLQERIEKLYCFIVMSDFRKEKLKDSNEQIELSQLLKFKKDCDDCEEDFIHSLTIVNEDYWEEYAEDFAKDCGYVDNERGNNNPLNDCIDWKAWADKIKQDYTELEYDGDTYYAR